MNNNCTMKKIFPLLLFMLFLGTINAQTIPPAPPDKAVVYFARTSSLGFAINFTYFDSARYIGKANGANYYRYECEPGPHLFWARSENRDFIEADVEAGKIYFLEVIPQMGAIKAAVRLNAVNPAADEKAMKRILKLLGKMPPETIVADDPDATSDKIKEIILRGLEKYQQEKAEGKQMERLEKTMYYQG